MSLWGKLPMIAVFQFSELFGWAAVLGCIFIFLAMIFANTGGKL